MHTAKRSYMGLSPRDGAFYLHRSCPNILLKCSAAKLYTKGLVKRPRRLSNHRLATTASAVQDLLALGFVTTASAGLLYSAVPLLTGQAKQNNKSRSDTYKDKDADPDDVKWGVMAVVSCIPLVNWTAWVFAAIDDDANAAKYYAFAAAYALPLLRNGFTFDSFLIASVLLCAAHVQVERIANTEPVNVAVPGVSDATQAATQQARRLTDSAKEWSASVQETSSRRRSEREELEAQNTDESRKQLSDDELKRWDARLRSKEQQDK